MVNKTFPAPADRRRGEPPMENTLLVGLSRLVTLERQVDTVANNVANVNTNGFKADRPLFEEYLRSPAHEDNFQRSDRRVSFVQDRGSFKDFAAGNTEMTKNPLDVSIDGRGLFVVQTPAGERYTRDGGFQINNQGQLVTASGNSVRGKLRIASFADPQKLVKEGSNLYSAGQGVAAQTDTTSRVRQGYIEKSNVNSVAEMSRMIEITRTYTQISALLQQQSDLHKSAIDKLAEVPA